MEKGSPTKRSYHDAAFRTEALRPASASHPTLAAAQALNISTRLLNKWRKATQQLRPHHKPVEAAACFGYHCYLLLLLQG